MEIRLPQHGGAPKGDVAAMKAANVARSASLSLCTGGHIAKVNSTFRIDRRRLLASAAAAATATGIAPHLRGAEAAPRPIAVQAVSAAPDKASMSVSAGMAKRLREIERRNEIRREAKLPLLSIPKELRRMKARERAEAFHRFEAAHGRAVWEQVLKPRGQVQGNPNWRPSWAEGVRLQSKIHKILWARFQQDQRQNAWQR